MNKGSIKILLIQENADDARLVREMLAGVETTSLPSRAFEVVHADRLETGLACLAEGEIDVVLLDLWLPDSQGLDTLDRAEAEAPGVPILVLTAREDETLALQALQRGAQDYLIKKRLNTIMLTRVLSYTIERHRLTAELQASEARLRTIIEENVDGIVIADRDGVVRFVNPAAECLFDCRPDELLGRVCDFPLRPGETVEYEIADEAGCEPSVVVEIRVVETMWQGEAAYLASLHDITERVRAEAALQYRSEFEKLIADISTFFVHLTPDDLDAGIEFALRAIGEFAAVDRSYVVMLSPYDARAHNTHEWCAEGIASQMDARQDLLAEGFPWWSEKSRQFQALVISRVSDLPSEVEAEKSLLEAQGVQSLVAVPMIYSSSLKGFVGFDAVREAKNWSEDIVILLKIVGEIFVNALERREAQRKIETALQEKEVLLREIHHRVKNNLQVISSLLDLQSKHADDARALQILQESRSRVRTMALIHERLYQTQDLSRVELAEYIPSLARDVFRTHRGYATGAALEVDVSDVFLDIDKAIPCGLIINELISNALKHAFPDGRSGEIHVALFSENGDVTLTVSDDGVGFPQDLDFRDTKSLGLKLVVTLTRQLQGSVVLERNGGTEFKIGFAA